MGSKSPQAIPTAIKELNTLDFAAFGDVIEVADTVKNFPINYGHTQRYHHLADIYSGGTGGKAIVSIFRSKPLPFPVKIEVMERHPLGSQTFFPLSPHPYLVLVAPAGEFDESAIEIFLARPGQGVNYYAGTWHHYSLALEAESDFLVVDRKGPDKNCDEVELEHPFTIAMTDIPS